MIKIPGVPPIIYNTSIPTNYEVLVDDNYTAGDPKERYSHGHFDTCEEAMAACKKIVEECLIGSYKAGMNEDKLYDTYLDFGDNPFIVSEDGNCKFNSREYAKSICKNIISNQLKASQVKE